MINKQKIGDRQIKPSRLGLIFFCAICMQIGSTRFKRLWPNIANIYTVKITKARTSNILLFVSISFKTIFKRMFVKELEHF